MNDRIVGNTIVIYQGENPDIRFNIKDKNGLAYDLTGGKAVLSYFPPGEDVDPVAIECTISATKAYAPLTSAETKALLGNIPYEFWCRNSENKIVMTKKGVLDFRVTRTPDVVTP